MVFKEANLQLSQCFAFEFCRKNTDNLRKKCIWYLFTWRRFMIPFQKS